MRCMNWWLGLLLLPLWGARVAGGAEAAMPDPLPELSAEETGIDVLTRGPVHDAFAEPVAREPSEGLVVAKKPPPPIDEVPPEAKPEGDDVVWIPGYWFWDDERRDYLWVSGVWRRAPPERRWVPGYWQAVAGGYQWVPGFWAGAAVAEVEYVDPPPESLEIGPSGPAAGEDDFWVPGSWLLMGGEYRWRPGFWHPYQSDWTWVSARYVWTPRGCVFVNGYWDYPLAGRGCLFAPVYFRRPVYLSAGFSYRPRCWIGFDSLLLHLFIRPSCQHYYFGDYYAGGYRDRYYACADYFRSHRGYCPIYTYYDQFYRHRGIDYAGRVRDWHRYYARHLDARPPHTWDAQRRNPLGRGNDAHLRAYGLVGRDLREIDRTADTTWRRTTVVARDLDRARASSLEIRQLADLRRRSELAVSTTTRRRGQPGEPVARRATLNLPLSSTTPAIRKLGHSAGPGGPRGGSAVTPRTLADTLRQGRSPAGAARGTEASNRTKPIMRGQSPDATAGEPRRSRAAGLSSGDARKGNPEPPTLKRSGPAEARRHEVDRKSPTNAGRIPGADPGRSRQAWVSPGDVRTGGAKTPTLQRSGPAESGQPKADRRLPTDAWRPTGADPGRSRQAWVSPGDVRTGSSQPPTLARSSPSGPGRHEVDRATPAATRNGFSGPAAPKSVPRASSTPRPGAPRTAPAPSRSRSPSFSGPSMSGPRSAPGAARSPRSTPKAFSGPRSAPRAFSGPRSAPAPRSTASRSTSSRSSGSRSSGSRSSGSFRGSGSPRAGAGSAGRAAGGGSRGSSGGGRK